MLLLTLRGGARARVAMSPVSIWSPPPPSRLSGACHDTARREREQGGTECSGTQSARRSGSKRHTGRTRVREERGQRVAERAEEEGDLTMVMTPDAAFYYPRSVM